MCVHVLKHGPVKAVVYCFVCACHESVYMRVCLCVSCLCDEVAPWHSSLRSRTEALIALATLHCLCVFVCVSLSDSMTSCLHERASMRAHGFVCALVFL